MTEQEYCDASDLVIIRAMKDLACWLNCPSLEVTVSLIRHEKDIEQRVKIQPEALAEDAGE